MLVSPVPFLFVFILSSVSTSFFFLTMNSSVSAISKAFNFKEVEDGEGDWLRVWDGIPSKNGMDATDIRSVKYYSDGRVLNATLWLSSLDELISSKYNINTIVYGMLIDSDLDMNTGKDGIDHLVEVKWNNITKTWTEEINEMSTNGYTNLISAPVSNNESYIKNGHVVNLSVNLSKISYPEKYRVFFYAYNSNKEKGAPWTVDLVRWVYVPPPEFRLVTDDTVINTTQHNKKILEIRVGTISGLEPKLKFEQQHHYKYLKTAFEPDVLNMTDDDKTELTITTNSSDVRKTTIPIKATISFPIQFLDAHSVIRTNETHNVTKYRIISQNSLADPLNLQLRISGDPPTWAPLAEIWNGLGGFFSFIYTPIAAIVTGLIGWYMGKNPDKLQRINPMRKKDHNTKGAN